MLLLQCSQWQKCTCSYSPGSDLDQIVLDRINDQVSRILAAGFSEDVGTVLIDRTFGDKQRIGDFTVRFAPADVQQNFGFPLRELLWTVFRNRRGSRLEIAHQIEQQFL